MYLVIAYKENCKPINYHLTNFQQILINLQNWQFFSSLLMCVSLTQEFSEKLRKVKGSFSSFDFAIHELPFEEAI